jgi:polysaccharide deacetylase 2 family uncharacterized protein YibQ
MASRTGAPRKKRRHTKKKKASQKKYVGTGLAILGVVAVGIFGYALYRLTLKHAHTSLPIFEAFPTQGIETKIKEIDRCIYNALTDLNIPPGDVAFKAVEPKRYKERPWTISGLEIRLPTTLAYSRIKEAFLSRLSARIPRESLRFALRSPQRLILDLSVNTHHTHRLVFVRPGEKKPVTSPRSNLPRVAIIIDDLGYDEEIASKFLALDGVMSFSVLPHSPFQETIARAVHHRGGELLLHLPMEPVEYPQVDPGAGALLSSMTPDRLLDQLRKNLDAVPYIVGVNNHMGSMLTQNPAKMRQIFTVLKKQNLFFVDSLTSPRSYGQQAARLLKLKFAQRQVFLDHDQDPHAIRFQIRRLISVAKERGRAIGIGHPYPITWEVLSEELSDIATQVELVRVSEVVG